MGNNIVWINAVRCAPPASSRGTSQNPIPRSPTHVCFLIIANGNDIVRMSRLVGHDSPKIRLDDYAHTPNDKKAARPWYLHYSLANHKCYRIDDPFNYCQIIGATVCSSVGLDRLVNREFALWPPEPVRKRSLIDHRDIRCTSVGVVKGIGPRALIISNAKLHKVKVSCSIGDQSQFIRIRRIVKLYVDAYWRLVNTVDFIVMQHFNAAVVRKHWWICQTAAPYSYCTDITPQQSHQTRQKSSVSHQTEHPSSSFPPPPCPPWRVCCRCRGISCRAR